MKICIICNQKKEESEFIYRNDTKKLRNSCKACDLNKKSEYYKKNKEKISQIGKEKRYLERKSYQCSCGKMFFGKAGSNKYCSMKCRIENLIEKDVSTGCWNWISVMRKQGYGQISTRSGPISAHRESYKIYKGEIPKGLFVCHSCDNKKCVNPDHLWLGTCKDNMQDAKSKGKLGLGMTGKSHSQKMKDELSKTHKENYLLGKYKIKKGSSSHFAKLKELEVIEIRKMLANGHEIKDVSEKYQVCKPLIYLIKSKKIWKHI